jgi:heme exporter protein C
MMKISIYIPLAIVTCAMMLVSTVLVFTYAPIEASMGVVQKIFYFHVSSAYTMYLAWVTCTVASIGYLSTRKEKWDMVAKSAAEIALVFATIVMITGPLWGRKAWGAYWTWDPRLTSTLLLTLIIISYVLLRTLATGEVERRFAAALAILGACVVPIIHLSVRAWRGQHPTVITGKGGGLSPDMRTVFFVCLGTFSLLFITILLRRYGLEKNRYRLAALEEEAAVKALTGDRR